MQSVKLTSGTNWSNVHKTGMMWSRRCVPPADSCQSETNPERTGEKPRRSSHVTGPGVHVEGLVPNVCFSNTLRNVSKHTGRYQREERALRLLELLLTQQGKALLEDFNPCCWRVNCKLVVECFQDAILLSDNLLKCPSSVQRWCFVRLAPGASLAMAVSKSANERAGC